MKRVNLRASSQPLDAAHGNVLPTTLSPTNCEDGNAPFEIPRFMNGDEPAARTGDLPTLEVFLIHEDAATESRARHVIDRMGIEMGLKGRVAVGSCRVDTVADPIMQGMAVENGRRASIVFLSLHGHRDLSPVISSWLEAWLATRDEGPCAMVLSLDAEMEGSARAESILASARSATAWARVEVFPHFAEAPWEVRLPGMPPVAACG